MNFHPELLKLISKPNESGSYCIICSSALKIRNSAYKDFVCSGQGHIFTVYEASLGSDYCNRFGFYNIINGRKYNVMFDFERLEMSFFNASCADSVIHIKDYNFVSLEDLIEKVDTYILFS